MQNTVRFIAKSEKTPCFIANFICRGRHHLREDQGRRAACLLLRGVSHRGLRRVLLLEQTQQRMRLCPWKTVELLLPGRKEIKTLTNLSRFPNLVSLPCTSFWTAAAPSTSLVVHFAIFIIIDSITAIRRMEGAGLQFVTREGGIEGCGKSGRRQLLQRVT